MQEKKYNIFAPWETLDKWQEDYINTEGNCFLLCGRQSGKSAAASIKFGKRAATNKNRAVYMLGYTEKQAYNLFFKTLMYLRANYPRLVIEKGIDKPTKHIISLYNGSKIFCYATGLTGDGIRGPTATDLCIDEAAPMANEVFTAIEPMLSVTGGSMDVLSTPKGTKNKDGEETFFYKCSKRKDFTKFYASAEDCPRHSKEFLERQKEAMSDLEYAQEYKAEFLDNFQRVISDETIKKITILERRELIKPNRQYFLGCDVGRIKDAFTYEIIDGTNKDHIEHVENLSTVNVPITESTRKIIILNEQYNFKLELIDSGGMGISVCDILREDIRNKRKVIEINNASRKYKEKGDEKNKGILKEDLYKNFISLIEQGKLLLLDDDDLKLALASLQLEITNDKWNFFGNNLHILEGLVRAVYGVKLKGLKAFII